MSTATSSPLARLTAPDTGADQLDALFNLGLTVASNTSFPAESLYLVRVGGGGGGGGLSIVHSTLVAPAAGGSASKTFQVPGANSQMSLAMGDIYSESFTFTFVIAPNAQTGYEYGGYNAPTMPVITATVNIDSSG